MPDDVMTPARKRQFIIGGLLMLMVIVLAAVVAANGQRLYMQSEGYFKTCSPVADEMICQYCKCPDGAGRAGFGSAVCDDGARPQCVSE